MIDALGQSIDVGNYCIRATQSNTYSYLSNVDKKFTVYIVTEINQSDRGYPIVIKRLFPTTTYPVAENPLELIKVDKEWVMIQKIKHG